MTIKNYVLLLGCAMIATSPALAQQATVINPTAPTAKIGGIQRNVDTLSITVEKLEDLLEKQEEESQKIIEDLTTEVDKLTDELDRINESIELAQTNPCGESSVSGTEVSDESCNDNAIRDGDDINLTHQEVTLFSKKLGLNYTESYTTPWLDTKGDIHTFNSVYKHPKPNCNGWIYMPFDGKFSIHDISSSRFSLVDSYQFSHPRSPDGCQNSKNTGHYVIRAQRNKSKTKVRLLIEVSSKGDFSGYYTGIWTKDFTLNTTHTNITKAGE